MEQKPTIGRIVHFKLEKNGPCRAAIITEVNQDNSICLQVFAPMNVTPIVARVFHEESTEPFSVFQNSVGSWHWPERT